MTVIQVVPSIATHYARVDVDPRLQIAACLVEGKTDKCSECDNVPAWYPVGLEGGGDPICADCMDRFVWDGPHPLPLPSDLPTHGS